MEQETFLLDVILDCISIIQITKFIYCFCIKYILQDWHTFSVLSCFSSYCYFIMFVYIVNVNALKEGPMEDLLYQMGYFLEIKNLLNYLLLIL